LARDSSALIQSTSALLASVGARMSMKSGRGRLSSTNNLTEKTLRNCPCKYAAWSPSCQSPTCQRPAVNRPFPDFESIAWYAANNETCSQSRSRLRFRCEQHRGGPFNRASVGRNNHERPRCRRSQDRARRQQAWRRQLSLRAKREMLLVGAMQHHRR
jgi:hypothetical protein